MKDVSFDTAGRATRRLPRWAACATVVLGTIGFAVVAASARADVAPCDVGTATIVWDGGAGTSSWNDAANWNDVANDQDRVPTSGDDVCVGTGGVTVVFAGGSTSVSSLEVVTGSALTVSAGSLSLDGSSPSSSSVATLTLSGGSLGGSGSLAVSSSFTWTDGDHTGSGTTTVSSGATFSMDTTVSNSTLGGTRQVVIASGATAQVSGSGTLYGSGSIANAGDLTLAAAPTLHPSVANTGTLIAAGLGNATVAEFFSNDGTVQVNAGTLTLSYPFGTSGGSFEIAGGTTLVLAGGTSTFSSSSSFTGDGELRIDGGDATVDAGATFDVDTLRVAGGSLSLGASSSVATLTLSGGSLGGSGSLAVSSSFTWTDGDHTGSGTTTVSSGATFSMDTTVSNSTLGGTRQVVIASGATAQVSGSGTLYGSGSIANAGDLTLAAAPTLHPTVANTGTLIAAGLGNATVAEFFSNDGTVQVNAGTLTLSYPFGTSGGSFEIAGGTTLVLAGGTSTFSSSSSFTGDGELRIDGGDATVDAGATFDVDTLRVARRQPLARCLLLGGHPHDVGRLARRFRVPRRELVVHLDRRRPHRLGDHHGLLGRHVLDGHDGVELHPGRDPAGRDRLRRHGPGLRQRHPVRVRVDRERR